METKFTKGEWIATNYGYEKWSVNGINGEEVCSAWNSNNAHLIASAPEMYEMLVSLNIAGGLGLDRHKRIDKLLAKARGEHE